MEQSVLVIQKRRPAKCFTGPQNLDADCVDLSTNLHADTSGEKHVKVRRPLISWQDELISFKTNIVSEGGQLGKLLLRHSEHK